MTATDGGPSPAGTGVGGGRPRRRRRTLLAVAAGLLVGCLVVGWYLEHRLTAQMGRIPGAFAGLEGRPEKPTSGAVDILLLGARPEASAAADAQEWLPGLTAGASVMVVHFSADRLGASVISIPTSAQVTIPGHGAGTLAETFRLGGPALTVGAVERSTGVRIDHLAVVDWAAFEDLAAQHGGAETQPLPTGPERLRIRQQHEVLRTVLDASLQQEMRKYPWLLYDFLHTVTANLSVDEGWSPLQMGRLVVSLRDLRSAQIRYLTAPTEGGGPALRLDPPENAVLWQSVREDRVDDWYAAHPEAGISDTVP